MSDPPKELVLRASPGIEPRLDGTVPRLTQIATGRYLVPVMLDHERRRYLLQLRNPDGSVFFKATVSLADVGGPGSQPYRMEFYGIYVIDGRDADEALPALRAEAFQVLFEMLPHFAPIPPGRAVALKDMTAKGGRPLPLCEP